MKRLILLLLSLTLTGVAVRAEQSLEDIDRMFGGYLTDHDRWERTYGGYRADEQNFPKPSENQVSMIERMGEIRQAYWDAYKKNGADFEAAKLQFASILFYRDVYQMLADIKPNAVPDALRSQADLEANKGGELLWQLWGNMMSLSTASGEPIRESAKLYFNDWSNFCHERLTASAKSTGIGIPDPGAIPGIWQKLLPSYQTYEVARDWAEDAAAPFPLPIDVYVFGLVRRWPEPATEEQAVQDYKVLLKTFGKDRVFEVAKKVQAAMNKEGEITDPDGLGITQQNIESKDVKAYREGLEKLPNTPEYDPQRKAWKEELEVCLQVQQNKASFYIHNPYWALWALLTKDDPKLTQLYQLYRDQKRGTGTDPSYLRKSVYALQPIVDEWNGVAPTPTPTPTPALTSTSTPTPVPTPVPTPTSVPTVVFNPGTWLTNAKEASSVATRQGKPILINFGGSDWCPWCTKMDSEVLSLSGFKNLAVKNLILLEIDWTRKTSLPPAAEAQRVQLWQKYGIKMVPTLVLIKSTGEEIDRCTGYVSEAQFLQWLENKVENAASTPVPTSTPTPTPTPTPVPTPYPGAADLWKEREHVVKQEYDKAWTALPEATRLKLHDEEETFQDTIKTFEPPIRMRTLRQRIEHFKSLTPRSARP
jgi:thiol-disulfide isomerase/thioredoxin